MKLVGREATGWAWGNGGGKLILVMSKTTSWGVGSEWKIESGKWKII